MNEALADSDDQEEDEECVDYRGATDRETLTEAIDTLRRLDEDVAPPPALTAPDSAAAALTPRSKAQLMPAPDVKREKTGESEAKEEVEATGQPSATTEDAPLATASSSAAVSSAPPPPPQRLTPRPLNRQPPPAPPPLPAQRPAPLNAVPPPSSLATAPQRTAGVPRPPCIEQFFVTHYDDDSRPDYDVRCRDPGTCEDSQVEVKGKEEHTRWKKDREEALQRQTPLYTDTPLEWFRFQCDGGNRAPRKNQLPKSVIKHRFHYTRNRYKNAISLIEVGMKEDQDPDSFPVGFPSELPELTKIDWQKGCKAKHRGHICLDMLYDPIFSLMPHVGTDVFKLPERKLICIEYQQGTCDKGLACPRAHNPLAYRFPKDDSRTGATRRISD